MWLDGFGVVHEGILLHCRMHFLNKIPIYFPKATVQISTAVFLVKRTFNTALGSFFPYLY